MFTSRLARSHRRSLIALLLAVLAGTIAYLPVSHTYLGARLEAATETTRFHVRGQEANAAPRDMVIAGFDDRTDQRLQHRFPYPRTMHAQALRHLHDAGAKVIAYDVQFIDPTDPLDDEALVAAAREAAPTVFATAPDPKRRGIPLPFASFDASPGTNPFDESRASIGLTHTITGADGSARAIPSRSSYARSAGSPDGQGRDVFPSFAVAVVAAMRGTDQSDVRAPDKLLLDYTVRHEDWRYIDYADAVLGTNLANLRGATVLVGATSPVLHDDFPTPFSPATPGVEIHAQAIDDLRGGHWLREAAGWSGPVAAAAIVLVAWLAMTTLSPLTGGLVTLATLFGYALLGQVAFTSRGLMLPMAPPLLAGAGAGVTLVARAAATTRRDRQRITTMFSRYVAPTLVRQLIEGGAADIDVGGERREVSVLFADIRGFTAMSEHMPPEEVVRQLNDYLAAMNEAIDDALGTLDKFIGDGIMAIFGAPLDQPDHADRACDAALAMVDRLATLNAERALRDEPALAIGIGINTGAAIVGNIGSHRRLDFTAIGDTVNLASRLEALTKQLGAVIVVSESTRAATSRHEFSSLGDTPVRGRTDEVGVYTLLRQSVLAKTGMASPSGDRLRDA